MVDCTLLLLFAILFLLFAVVLILHHRWKHSNSQELSACEKWFQLSDICNCHSWNHEQFILLCLFISIILFVGTRNCNADNLDLDDDYTNTTKFAPV